jgi:DNA-binding LytR/AlgR family response regulator
MINVVIIEDEKFATEKLERQLHNIDSDCSVVATLESVKQSVLWLKQNKADLIFLDIHLADGLCFRIFDEVEITTPIIFTTAYDQYAIQAFKVNSVDYLLKPINKYDLAQSLDKFKAFHSQHKVPDYSALLHSLSSVQEKNYQKRFMVAKGDTIKTILVEDVAYFFAEGKYAFLVTKNAERFLIDFSLENLYSKLNPADFFRVNRQVIVKLNSIKEMSNWFKRRIKLVLNPPFEKETIVAIERIKEFKDWLNQ